MFPAPYLADWDGMTILEKGRPPYVFLSGAGVLLPDLQGNNAVTWNPTRYDWYETVKLNYGYNFMAGLPALRLLPDWTSPKQHVPKTWRIMDDILSFWQGLGIGGFRCDMAQMIPMAFWKWAISRSRVRLPDVFFSWRRRTTTT